MHLKILIHSQLFNYLKQYFYKSLNDISFCVNKNYQLFKLSSSTFFFQSNVLKEEILGFLYSTSDSFSVIGKNHYQCYLANSFKNISRSNLAISDKKIVFSGKYDYPLVYSNCLAYINKMFH
jgi:hypothetical protein